MTYKETSLCNEGTVTAHPRGFGFIKTDTDEDIFVPPPAMRLLVPGDRVRFERTLSERNGQLAANAIEVLHRPRSYWLGVLNPVGPRCSFVADDALPVRVAVSDAVVAPDDVVQVCIEEGACIGQSTVQAHVVANLGPRSATDFDVRYAIAKWQLPVEFTAEQIAEAIQFQEPSVEKDETRVDLTALPFATIDGESTKDFDDAIFVSRTADEFVVRVAIADVSHYVRPGTALDAVAKERGTSVYLPDRVLPMLPPQLSTGLCSLNPLVNRYALVCQLHYGLDGEQRSRSFYRAVIRSHERLTYANAAALKCVDALVAQMLQDLKQWFDTQLAQRAERGLMEYRNEEPKLAQDSEGRQHIEWLSALPSHAWVEECMLAANRAVAAELKDRLSERLFRHQDGLDDEKWMEAATWATSVAGISVPGGKPTLLELRHALAQTDDPSLSAQLAFRLRRSMVPAVYDTGKSSHFSLGFTAYTHFTSPIRRYADLLVHRMLLDSEYTVPAETAMSLTALSRRAKVASRYPWERLKRRLLWQARPERLQAQVIGQSPYSCRVAVMRWDVLAVVPAHSLKEQGWQWSAESQTWRRTETALMDGMLVWVSLTDLVSNAQHLELQAALDPRQHTPDFDDGSPSEQATQQ